MTFIFVAEILQEQLQKEEVKVNGEDKHDPKQVLHSN
jgi:acid stress-induced BolA-like protein IbaG/YrbA